MLKKEFIGKNSVFVLYAFLVFSLIAGYQINFGNYNEYAKLYLFFPILLGILILVCSRNLKLDFRITNKADEKPTLANHNIFFMVLSSCKQYLKFKTSSFRWRIRILLLFCFLSFFACFIIAFSL